MQERIQRGEGLGYQGIEEAASLQRGAVQECLVVEDAGPPTKGCILEISIQFLRPLRGSCRLSKYMDKDITEKLLQTLTDAGSPKAGPSTLLLRIAIALRIEFSAKSSSTYRDN